MVSAVGVKDVILGIPTRTTYKMPDGKPLALTQNNIFKLLTASIKETDAKGKVHKSSLFSRTHCLGMSECNPKFNHLHHFLKMFGVEQYFDAVRTRCVFGQGQKGYLKIDDARRERIIARIEKSERFLSHIEDNDEFPITEIALELIERDPIVFAEKWNQQSVRMLTHPEPYKLPESNDIWDVQNSFYYIASNDQNKLEAILKRLLWLDYINDADLNSSVSPTEVRSEVISELFSKERKAVQLNIF